jgi:putative phosphoribosyl transferase
MFRDRTEAGEKLAEELAAVVHRPAVVAAIPRGGVAVALPVVERLRVPLTIVCPRTLTAPVAAELSVGALAEAPALHRVPPLEHYLPGATVVLVDDGLATGLTMGAAVADARRLGAREVVVAVPCSSQAAARRFRAEADRFVSLVVDPDFSAVGAYYTDFSPVSDEEVLAMLAEAAKRGERRVAAMRVVFRNARGLEVTGALLTPEDAGPHPVVVFAHGWGRGQATGCDRVIAEALVAEGIGAFLFDFTGHGESQGTLAESTPAQPVDDLRAAIALLGTLDDVDSGRLGVAGEGSAAAAALRCAADLPAVSALVLCSATTESEAEGGAAAVAGQVTAPTLLVVGDRDAPSVAENEALLRLLFGPRRLELVPGGADVFEHREGLVRVAELTTAWFARHLEGGR